MHGGGKAEDWSKSCYGSIQSWQLVLADMSFDS